MKFSNPRTLSVLVLSTALAACGGSSTTTTLVGTLQPNGLPFATNQVVRTTTLVGANIKADDSRVAFTSGTILSSGNSDLSFEVVNASTIILTSGSNTWRLENQGSNPNSPSSADVWIAQRNVNGNPSNLSATFGQTELDNNGNPVAGSLQSIFFGNIQELPNIATPGSGLSGNSFAISGFETNPDEIAPLTATATYTGDAVITSDRTSSGNPLLLMDGGTMNVNVNYGGSDTVSGTLSGTASGFGGGNLVVDLTPTDIASGSNSFSTSFSRSSASTSAGVTGMSGTLTGTLYGADAAEMGLLLNGTAQTSSGNVDAAGYGLGIKQ